MATELPYHCQLSKIGRSQGRSSTAAAAYRSGQRIVDESTGEIHDYTRKRGVEDSLIVLPQGGTMDRSALWNKVEKHHKRGDAVVAREIEVALPRTLNAEQRRRLVQSYAAKLADRYGVAVDACIHEPHAVTDADLIANPDQFFVTEADGRRHNGNWHCHILMSACHCDAEGVLGKKVVELDEMHCYRAGIPNAAQEQRPAWAAAVNEALVEADQGEYFVDHRSFEERGITDRVPTEHRGPAVTAILRRGGQSHVADAQATSQLSRLARAVEAAGEAVEAIQAELASAVREAAAVAAAAVAVVAPLPAAAEPVQAPQEARQDVPRSVVVPGAVLPPGVALDVHRRVMADMRRERRGAGGSPPVSPAPAGRGQEPAKVADAGPREPAPPGQGVPRAVKTVEARPEQSGPVAAPPVQPAPPTAAERRERLRLALDRASQAARLAADQAEPYWLADGRAEAARDRLKELAAERVERLEAIAERPVLHRFAALLGDPDKQRIAEIDTAAGKAQAALRRAEADMAKAKPLHDRQKSAEAHEGVQGRALRDFDAEQAREARMEADRQRRAEISERLAQEAQQPAAPARRGPRPG